MADDSKAKRFQGNQKPDDPSEALSNGEKPPCPLCERSEIEGLRRCKYCGRPLNPTEEAIRAKEERDAQDAPPQPSSGESAPRHVPRSVSFLVSGLAWLIAFVIAAVLGVHKQASGYLLCLVVSVIFVIVRGVLTLISGVPPVWRNK